MKGLSKVLLLLFALAVTYLVMLPPTWIDALLQRATRSALAMTGATGTFWRGEGTLQAILPTGVAVTLVPVSWDIAPGALLALKLHINARSTRDNTPVLNATFGLAEFSIQDATLELPAGLIGVVSPTLRAADLSGMISVNATDIHWDRSHAAGKVRAYWKSAGSNLSRVNPLGSYMLTLDGQGAGLDFHLITMGGALTLTGSGTWRPGLSPDIRLVATPDKAAQQDLVPLLRMMGREISPGTYQLAIDSNVQPITN
jgi:general secretion pathway protein N